MEVRANNPEGIKAGLDDAIAGKRPESGKAGPGPKGDGYGGDPSGGEAEGFKPNIVRIGIFALIMAVAMTFGGLIVTYVVLATNKPPEWNPFSFPRQIWIQIGISSLMIIFSSIAYEIANRSLQKGNQVKAKNYFVMATAFGAVFIASQVFVWFSLSNQGVYLSGNPYAGLFYIITAAHAIHVLGGIFALIYVVLKNQHHTGDDDSLFKRQVISKSVGWYWHFMGGLWVILFLMLSFWK